MGGRGLQPHTHQARAPMGVGETLDRSLRLYRSAFLPIAGLSALFVVPYTIAQLFVNTASTGDLLLVPLLRTAGRPMPMPSAESVAGFTLLMGLGGLFVIPLVYCALIRVADQAWRGESPAMGKALVWSLRRLFALAVTALIVVIAGGLLSLVAFMIAAMMMGLLLTAVEGPGFDASSQGLTVAAGVIVAVFFVVGSLLMQIAWQGFLFVPQVIVMESRGYFVAIGRSIVLAWSYPLRTTALFLGTILLTLSLNLIVLLPMLLWSTAVGESGAGVVTSIAQSMIWTLTFPLLPVVTTVVYHDLRLRREGHDLEERLRSLEEEVGHA